MGNFYQDVIKKDPRFHSTKVVNDLALLEPVTREAVQCILADAEKMGIPLMVFETYRSKELQQIYYTRGVTTLKKVGVHHYGLAGDLVKLVNGDPSWKGSFDFMLELAERYNLISGLNWGQPDKRHSFIDPVHVQRITLADQDALFDDSWYPRPDYSPYE